MKLTDFFAGAMVLAITTGGVVYATEAGVPVKMVQSRAVATNLIPGSLDLNDWNYAGCQTENNGGNVGYVKTGATAEIDFTCIETGVYEMEWTWSYAKTGNVNIVVKDLISGKEEINQDWDIIDGPSTVELYGLITEGDKNIKFTITSSTETGFLGNYTVPTFSKIADTFDTDEIPEGWDVIPGTLPLEKWSLGGGLRLESGDGASNIGWAQNGGFCTDDFFCTEDGVYNLDINFYWFQNPGDFKVTVTDIISGEKELEYTYQFAAAHQASIPLPAVITKGRKSIRFDLSSDAEGFLVNWYAPEFTKIADTIAEMSDLTVSDESIVTNTLDGFDYAFVLPVDYSGETVVFTPAIKGAVATLSASDGIEVSDLGNGSYSIPAPASNGETVVTVTLDAEDGAYKVKDQYNVRFFRLGDVTVSRVVIDGFELGVGELEALNSSEIVGISKYVFTAMPEVSVTFADGSSAEVSSSHSGNSASFYFHGKAGDKTKLFRLIVDGVYIYERQEGDMDATLRFNESGKKDNNTWSNGLYTVAPVNDGWGGTQFKFHTGNGHSYSVTAPSDMIIKQFIIAGLFDNYQPGKIVSVTSGDAIVRLPSASSFVAGGPGYNLVVNIENHVPGTPVEVEFEGGSQPVAWFDFVYETSVPADAPQMLEQNFTDLTGKNHTVVSFTFNREMKAPEVDFNGSRITGLANGTTVSFPLWDLDYETEYTLTLPAGSVQDTYGNLTDKDVSCTFTTGKDNDVKSIMSDRFIVVTDVSELLEAVAGLSSTNNDPSSPSTVIHIVDGDYDLGDNGHLDINNVYNVSLVGQSENGVVIHGKRRGITDAVLSTRHSGNIYMENFTVRNDLDFGAETRVDVGVAHYGGKFDIMKNVTLQSVQDTQVTGERGYYYNCTIHGAVDYICGGGNHYYDHCTLVQEGDGYITAPATSVDLRHGYVFRDCVIKGNAGEKGYTLGRPWKDEPRCYWINTTMEILPVDAGWSAMSTLPTHFYEYGSKDADGSLLDLSVRQNSSTSTNTYTPVLTADEAAELTHRNVIGYLDSVDPTELTVECEAPVVIYNESGLSWNSVPNAAGYIVYSDDKPIRFTTATTHSFAEAAVLSRAQDDPVYTVAAISASGSRGKVSEPAKADDGTSIIAVGSDAPDAEYFNLQGHRVENPAHGVYIRRQGNKVDKVIL